ncbi:acyltransferase [Nonomuraea sp. NN258]|nr:acyltransferase [Nonomuraea antri]
MRRIGRLADRTPAGRDRPVDLLRAIAICAVIVGHWLAVHVTHGPGGLRGGNVLELVPWTRPLTWVFQVMPIFFLVGGYAGAASLASHRSRGGGATTWILRRTDRLLRPTSTLLATLVAAALAARVLGADTRLVATAVWLAAIPLWFLVVYLAVVALTPAMHALHRRHGLAVPIVLAGAVAAGDAVRLLLRMPVAGSANFLLAWLAVHQLGFAWQDGRLPAGRRVAVPLTAGGLVALVLLTVAGPYPISMVGVPGQEIQNTSPPTLALLALAAVQTGLALWAHDPAARLLRRRRPWLVVVAVNAVIMTLFLWHMSAAVLGALALYPTGVLPQPPPGTPLWLLLRVPWLVVLALILAVLVLVFGPVELRAGPAGTGSGTAGVAAGVFTVLGLAAVVAGLLGIAAAGPGRHGVAGLPTAAVAGYFAGAGLLRIIRRRCL